MAFDPASNLEAWIVEEQGSDVLRAIEETSAIERIAKKYTMRSDAYQVPRSGGVDLGGVAKGGAYGIEETDYDKITLVAKKFGAVFTLNHEDLQDPELSAVENIRMDWGRAYALNLDNACLGVSGAADHPSRPFVSAYRSLRTSNPETGYVADDNYILAGADGLGYNELSEVLGKVEQGEYFDQSGLKVIAHPAARQALREIKDQSGRPIFVEHTNSGGGGAAATATVFGLPVEWSLGARVSDSMTKSPTGGRLLYVVNANFLALGVRSGPETAIADEDSGPAFMTDQALMKMRSRRGFALTVEQAAAVVEF